MLANDAYASGPCMLSCLQVVAALSMIVLDRHCYSTDNQQFVSSRHPVLALFTKRMWPLCRVCLSHLAADYIVEHKDALHTCEQGWHPTEHS